MKVVGLWRYPVKSMRGEALSTAAIGPTGVAGDRSFGVVRVDNGHVLSAKREGRLLQASARLDGGLHMTLPTGQEIRELGGDADAALSAWLGYAVRLAAADPSGQPTFETQMDFYDDASPTSTWQGIAGSWVDSRPVHLLTTAALRILGTERPDLEWAVQRFRPNVLLEADEDLPGETKDVELGQVRLHIDKPCNRCVMVTRAQPASAARPPGATGKVLPRQLDVLRHLEKTRSGDLGVLAQVETPGNVALGDECRVREPHE